MADYLNIRLKLVRSSLVILVGLGLKVDWNQILPLHASLSIDNTECVSIDYCLQSSTTGLFDGQLWVFIILSLKCTKITTFLQITPKPENILKRLQNNYNVFKNTYIPWLKMGKIYGISTPPDLLFCLSSSKTTSSLSGNGLKTAETHTIYHHLNNTANHTKSILT